MSNEVAIDILAFAPHPDDAELGCGGFIAAATKRNQSVAIAELTRGELGSQGSVERRKLEADAAAKVLGVTTRFNLELPDGNISEHCESQLDSTVALIRMIQPSLVLAPYWEGRHPDHAAAGSLIIRASFLAALKQFKPELGGRFQVPQTIHYALRRTFTPTFISNVTEVYQTKLAAIECFSSQVKRQGSSSANLKDPGPLISSPLSVSSIEARDRFYGAQIGVEYGEAFCTRGALRIDDALDHFNKLPTTAALLFDDPW